MSKTPEQKKHTLFMVLMGIFLTNAIVAEIIGGKIFQPKLPWVYNLPT